MVATVLGFLGVVGFLGLALLMHSFWTGAIAVFMLMNCWGGLQHARVLLRHERLPRRQGFACPSCGATPLLGENWKCAACGQRFDTFLTGGVCPHCAAQYPTTMCGDCGKFHPMNEWVVGRVAGIGLMNGGV
jgi:DNA-directed RNA polymerase subunit RPC12/RpoP